MWWKKSGEWKIGKIKTKTTSTDKNVNTLNRELSQNSVKTEKTAKTWKYV
jgi:hypothetical protein